MYEIVAFRPGEALPTGFMQIAVDRWLVLERLPTLAEGFAVTDVTGKWRRIQVDTLLNAVDIEGLLANRNCARTAIFDCPVLVQKAEPGYVVWVERSYEHAFNIALEQAAAL